ncbi:DUF1684 domain-containing protein [Arthrobacter sp. A5]|uniref:DUF1684 domain-containing protein n=1 Tax=Arthrobacter sp. A5 TaxID=576926 RepID=UPI003DA85871
MSSNEPSASAEFQKWNRFRDNRDTSFSADHGWLSLTSLQWLPARPAPLELLPGLWSAEADGAVLTAEPGDRLTLLGPGTPVAGTPTAALADEESLLWVRSGSIVAELARRGGRYAVRTRDSQSPTLRAFDGVPAFAYRPDLVLPGRFEPYPVARPVPRNTANPQVTATAAVTGEVTFDLNGRTHRLLTEDGGDGALEVTFHDSTNGSSTAGWRKLTIPVPAADGSVLLDFNRAVNYPSAFTAFGTCPMPVRGNILDTSIEAGEKTPPA